MLQPIEKCQLDEYLQHVTILLLFGKSSVLYRYMMALLSISSLTTVSWPLAEAS
jgi:hypothetical protein